MESIWTETASKQTREPLSGDKKTDVLIVGGGMAGVLCAHKLHGAGVNCIVVEEHSVGGGVTQKTTAKITAQHALIYADLIEKYGEEFARLYYEANKAAIDDYRELSKSYPCDLEEQTAYVYTAENADALKRESDAYDKLNIPKLFSAEPPLPFPTAGALGMPDQAQFHPLKLLYALSGPLEIYENTKLLSLDGHTATTEKGTITAKHVVLATHYPFVNVPGLYFMKLYQHRSYVAALKNAPEFEGMYISANETGYSFRHYNDLLLVGDGAHKTGKKGGGFQPLLEFTKTAYPQAEQVGAWATQDCMSLDGVPYIGRHRRTAPYLYVATGFNKWGMTGSMTAANVICDLITKGHSDYEKVFSPQRPMLCKQLFVNMGAAVAGLFSFGKRCTHLGCALNYNAEEHSWDCPCHGSRYDEDGRVLNNPAKKAKKL